MKMIKTQNRMWNTTMLKIQRLKVPRMRMTVQRQPRILHRKIRRVMKVPRKKLRKLMMTSLTVVCKSKRNIAMTDSLTGLLGGTSAGGGQTLRLWTWLVRQQVSTLAPLDSQGLQPGDTTYSLSCPTDIYSTCVGGNLSMAVTCIRRQGGVTA